MRSACRLTVQPAIRVRLSLFFKPAHIVPYTSTSRQASAPNLQAGVCPGEPTGARRLPKPFFKKFYLNEPQFLGSLTSGTHSPDVDDQSSSHCHHGLFLEHFISAAKASAPLPDGAVVRLKTP